MVEQVLARFPHLREDRAVWEATFDPGNNQVHDCFSTNDLEGVLHTLTPEWVLNDKQLMYRAVDLGYFAMYDVPDHLGEDYDLG